MKNSTCLTLDQPTLDPCPQWCTERHSIGDTTHYGPCVEVDAVGLAGPLLVALQRDNGRDTEIVILPTASETRFPEPRTRAFTIDQARTLAAALSELLDAVDGDQA